MRLTSNQFGWAIAALMWVGALIYTWGWCGGVRAGAVKGGLLSLAGYFCSLLMARDAWLRQANFGAAGEPAADQRDFFWFLVTGLCMYLGYLWTITAASTSLLVLSNLQLGWQMVCWVATLKLGLLRVLLFLNRCALSLAARGGWVWLRWVITLVGVVLYVAGGVITLAYSIWLFPLIPTGFYSTQCSQLEWLRCLPAFWALKTQAKLHKLPDTEVDSVRLSVLSALAVDVAEPYALFILVHSWAWLLLILFYFCRFWGVVGQKWAAAEGGLDSSLEGYRALLAARFFTLGLYYLVWLAVVLVLLAFGVHDGWEVFSYTVGTATLWEGANRGWARIMR